MKVEIRSTVDNKLLDRKEIEAEVSYDGPTPSRKDLKQAICGKVGANPDLVVLREVNTTYGKQMAMVIVHSYAKKESLVGVEPEHMVKREGFGEEKKEAPKEGASEEAPKEEKKE